MTIWRDRRRLGHLVARGRDLLAGLEGRGGPLLDLAIRLYLARVFFVSGVLKAANWDTALLLAANEYPVSWLDPATAAWIGVAIELVCPVFLAFGLLTRMMAVPVAILALVIEFNYLELPDHLFWAILAGWLIVRGPGPISLDRLFAGLAESAVPGAATVARLTATIDRLVAPLYLLFIRLWMAQIFWAAGQAKLANWDLTVLLFAEEYRVPLLPPDVAAILATTTEVGMPVLLAAGLAARLAALPLVAMTLVIQFTYLDRPEHFLWLMTLGLIALRGAGPISLDHVVAMVVRRLSAGSTDPGGQGVTPPPHVVIVGAGFGGLACARDLAHAPARVTVIDRRNYHLFQPLLYQVATASLSPADIALPIREILRGQDNARVLLARVTGIDPATRTVRMDSASLHYDYLVLATGARHSYFGRDEWEKFAPGLKKIDDATRIRARILTAFERAEATEDLDERRALLTFVVIGGGPTGVELAGAIVELARFGMSRDFRHIDPAAARVLLVEAGPRLLATFPEKLADRAQDQLAGLGVEVMTRARVADVDAGGIIVDDARIAARTVLWAAGVEASPAAKWLGLAGDRAGRIPVGPDLSVPGLQQVFVVGDTALALDERHQPIPGLAPAATQGGAYVARVIQARLAGGRVPGPFRYRHRGSMATIGRKAAIADLGRLKLSGLFAWWLWGAVHVAFLVGVRNRISVMLGWLWSYLTFRRGIRLITGAEN